MRQILVLHAMSHYMRQTTFEFNLSFGRYAPEDCNVIYHNIRDPHLPEQLKVGFDSLFLTYDLLGLRSSNQWNWVTDRIGLIRSNCDQLIAFPQDDYTSNIVLDDSLFELKTDVIYSPIESGLEILYPKMSRHSTIRHALTGYVDETLSAEYLSKWESGLQATRSIDIGTRVRALPPWIGKRGMEKGNLAEAVRLLSQKSNLILDVSTDTQDVFFGTEWHDFLLSCKATIGQKGGASLCDPNGSIAVAVKEYMDKHPNADFEMVEKSCFPGLDGLADMSAISPRLFDAAMTGTVQILIEDDYLGLLEPWVHYIPTDSKLSNFEEITSFLGKPQQVLKMANAAADTLVRSNRFTYRSFVTAVLKDSNNGSNRATISSTPTPSNQLQWLISSQLFEALQQVLYLSRATNTTDEISELFSKMKHLSFNHKELVTHFDHNLFSFLTNWQSLNPAINDLMPTIIDIARECILHGGVELVQEIIICAQDTNLEDWHFLDWVSRDHIELRK
jgi:hypothetical protein